MHQILLVFFNIFQLLPSRTSRWIDSELLRDMDKISIQIYTLRDETMFNFQQRSCCVFELKCPQGQGGANFFIMNFVLNWHVTFNESGTQTRSLWIPCS
ncbi:hypothetical protein HNY73_000356 [Argiope bruennichi]|uniref:Secreted protein n=1 Tax=Argiope bruennichi TaxID=94029 RepID=A0A8T0G250_ARGBR|nr:hypothetical protein HNY73_000356 [Argiope bruennichi]